MVAWSINYSSQRDRRSFPYTIALLLAEAYFSASGGFIFQLAENDLPLAENGFPLAENGFPLAENGFPLAEIGSSCG